MLHKLEESMSEQTEMDQKVPADRDSLDLLDSLNVEQTASRDQIRPVEVEAIREFLSAKNLKSVKNDSSRRSSSCFGRRMDRIGSMSSLGCNTVGKSSKSTGGSHQGSLRNLRQELYPELRIRTHVDAACGAGDPSHSFIFNQKPILIICFSSSLADPK